MVFHCFLTEYFIVCFSWSAYKGPKPEAVNVSPAASPAASSTFSVAFKLGVLAVAVSWAVSELW